MSNWMNEWAAHGNGVAAGLREHPEVCTKHHVGKEVGYSTMGIAIVICPQCSPDLRSRPCGDVWEVDR